jgi:hypothetical protein
MTANQFRAMLKRLKLSQLFLWVLFYQAYKLGDL